MEQSNMVQHVAFTFVWSKILPSQYWDRTQVGIARNIAILGIHDTQSQYWDRTQVEVVCCII